MKRTKDILLVLLLCTVAGAVIGLIGWRMGDITIPWIATVMIGILAVGFASARVIVALLAACSLSLGHIGFVYAVQGDGDDLGTLGVMLLLTYSICFISASLISRYHPSRRKTRRDRSETE